jgi:hypothetical protein
MNSNLRFLGDLEEGIGNLEHVAERDGFAIAQFRGFSLLLPLELKLQLGGLTGHRVGIIRIDGSYRIRVDEGKHIELPGLLIGGGEHGNNQIVKNIH